MPTSSYVRVPWSPAFLPENMCAPHLLPSWALPKACFSPFPIWLGAPSPLCLLAGSIGGSCWAEAHQAPCSGKEPCARGPGAGSLSCSALTPALSSHTDCVSCPSVALSALSTRQAANLGDQGLSADLRCYCDAPLHIPAGDRVLISALL